MFRRVPGSWCVARRGASSASVGPQRRHPLRRLQEPPLGARLGRPPVFTLPSLPGSRPGTGPHYSGLGALAGSPERAEINVQRESGGGEPGYPMGPGRGDRPLTDRSYGHTGGLTAEVRLAPA